MAPIVETIAGALAALTPARRSAVVRMPPAPGAVPAEEVVADTELPARACATIDGFAVRAIDTADAADTLPVFLEITGAVAVGRVPEGEVGPGAAMTIPAGGLLPHGADAVIAAALTTAPMPGHVELTRPAAPGDGVLHPGEECRPGDVLAPPGRPLRPADLGLLAAAGITDLDAHVPPRVGLVTVGVEVVPPGTAEPALGQVRDACAPALAALVREAGGEPVRRGNVPDDAAELERVLGTAVAEDELVVVAAGHELTAGVVARLGRIVCHGLALDPGGSTLLADCGGVPLLALPGDPRSALVAFRLVGLPLVRIIGGVTAPPPPAIVSARLAHDVVGVAARLDVVQVTLAGGVATPCLGAAALLGPMARADGWIRVPEPAAGLAAGTVVDVERYR